MQITKVSRPLRPSPSPSLINSITVRCRAHIKLTTVINDQYVNSKPYGIIGIHGYFLQTRQARCEFYVSLCNAIA